MSAHHASGANRSGIPLAAEGKERREETRSKGRPRVDIDPAGCETDFEIKGKSKYEASIVANRIFLKGDASPCEVERITIEVNSCDASDESVFKGRDGNPIPLARGEIGPIDSALFCEKCLAKKLPKRFMLYPDAKTSGQ